MTVIPPSGPPTFDQKTANFPEEVYNLTRGTHLYNYLWTLLEDPGVGQLQKVQVVARLAEAISNTSFSDLDYFFGEFLRFPRKPEEMYPWDPFRAQLTSTQWDEVHTKDARYRRRLSMLLQAFQRGATMEGVQMAAEAASGVRCQVLETWRYALGHIGAVGRLNAAKEFVVIPFEDLDPSSERAVYRAANRIKPANTLCTVAPDGLGVQTEIQIRGAASPSEYFEVRRTVSFPVANAPATDTWITPGGTAEAPMFAYLREQETSWSVNDSVVDIEAFSYDVNTGPPPPPFGSPLLPGTLPAVLAPLTQQFGPWHQIELADSSDNFPGGKYPGDPARYDAAGKYIYSWKNQAKFVAFITSAVKELGGEVVGDRYRLPVSAAPIPGPVSSPWDALAGPVLTISATYYGSTTGSLQPSAGAS